MANLTLSVDEDLLKKSRIYAIEHDTSVNSLVRDYLKSLCGEAAQDQVKSRQEKRLQAIAELDQLAREVAAQASIPEGYRFKREDAYEDRDALLAGRHPR